MNRLSPDALRLIELTRHEDDPDVIARMRVQHRLSLKMGAAPGIAAGLAVAEIATSKSTLGSVLTLVSVKAGGLALLLVGVGAGIGAWGEARFASTRGTPCVALAPMEGATWHSHHLRSPLAAANRLLQEHSDDPRVIHSGIASANAADLRAKSPAAPPRPAMDASPLASPPATAPEAPPADVLLAETQALREAQRALRNGEFEKAVALLNAQELKFGDGQLAEERAAARAIARCRLTGASVALAEAGAFARRWSQSPLLPKVHEACSRPVRSKADP